MNLNEFRKNEFSQFGEDGIIEKIFKTIRPKNKLCLEFGAWDGLYLSNTANLWKNKDWNAILIESNKSKFDELLKNTKSYNSVTALHEHVDNSLNSLDIILDKNNLSKDIDFLSIDIDGNDFYILESLQFRPSVICIEYNPTIPYWMNVKQDFNDKNRFGASPKAIIDLANNMDYFFAAATDVNIFLINKKYEKSFLKYDNNISELITKDYYNIIISTYDGVLKEYTPFIYGKKQ